MGIRPYFNHVAHSGSPRFHLLLFWHRQPVFEGRSGVVLPDRRPPGVAVVDRVVVGIAGRATVLPEALVADRRVVRTVDLVALARVDVAVQTVVYGSGVRRTRPRQHRAHDKADASRSHRKATTGLGLGLREHSAHVLSFQ